LSGWKSTFFLEKLNFDHPEDALFAHGWAEKPLKTLENQGQTQRNFKTRKRGQTRTHPTTADAE
jgi:hypothetical protein